MLISDSSKPLYLQLKQAVTEDINRGVYSPGEKLPNEAELCDKYNVSRITVRKAVLELVEEGYLVRQQGKGTFVKQPKFKRELVSVEGYSEYMVSTGKVPHHKIISFEIKEASKKISEKLNIPLKAMVFELKRTFYHENQPLAYEITSYSLERFPQLDQYIQDGSSMHKILRNQFGVIPAYNDKVLNVIFASSEEADILECNVSDPLFEIEKVAFNEDKTPIYLSFLYYRTSDVSFTITGQFTQE